MSYKMKLAQTLDTFLEDPSEENQAELSDFAANVFRNYARDKWSPRGQETLMKEERARIRGAGITADNMRGYFRLSRKGSRFALRGASKAAVFCLLVARGMVPGAPSVRWAREKQAALRNRIIRLAWDNPDMRPHLLPILERTAANAGILGPVIGKLRSKGYDVDSHWERGGQGTLHVVGDSEGVTHTYYIDADPQGGVYEVARDVSYMEGNQTKNLSGKVFDFGPGGLREMTRWILGLH